MNERRVLRVYADTPVFGGCFDVEFARPSKEFFARVREGLFRLVVSETTLLELRKAPEKVQRVLSTLPPDGVEEIEGAETMEKLREAYLAAGVLDENSRQDAEPVAWATVAEVDFVVSWNFKHLVHYEKISGFQGVNLIHGHKAIQIYSPLEVI